MRLIDNGKYPLDFAKCGTPAQYTAHRRRGQEACRKCKIANAIYQSNKQAKKR